MSLDGLARRVRGLERAHEFCDSLERLEMEALEAANLTDDELLAMIEVSTLQEYSHTEVEIEEMIAERWLLMLAATERVNAELDRLKAQRRRK